MFNLHTFYILIVACCIVNGQDKDVPPECFQTQGDEPGNPGVNCAVTNTEGLTILVSTLDGGLFAVDKKTGSIRWKLVDEPVVKSPYDPVKPVLPAFLPDPKDGTLYMMGGSLTDPLKKLPFTIPELVAASPSKSAEGILYSGKKVDTWFSIDRNTGRKHGALNYLGCLLGEENTCPAASPGSFLIGRTEYNIMMYDTRTRDRKWNITYYDYSSNMGSREPIQDYDLAHFSDSSTGILITLDKSSGRVEWETRFNSPVVAMYQLDDDTIFPLPFTSVSIETLENLIQNFESSDEKLGETKLFPTLYVGEHAYGLFAVPSLVDKQTIMISPSRQPLLIEGPSPGPEDSSNRREDEKSGSKPLLVSALPSEKSSLLVFGYYQIPEYKPEPSPGLTPYLITSLNPLQSDDQIKLIENFTNQTMRTEHVVDNLHSGIEQILKLNTTFLFSRDLINFLCKELIPHSAHILQQIENKELKLIFLVLFFTVVWFIRFVKYQFKVWERMGTHSNSASQGSVNSHSNYEITANPVELVTGEIKVGNLTFHPDIVLGKGCEGTFVYKGSFDGRDVAVKRVLAACFSIADREVDLLRESDEHPNVIRYFCMEQCRQFRYIALELCAATLQEYIEGKYKTDVLDITSVFRQSVQGLAHLHGLDIAHRDIKPQNVLISLPGRRGEVRAMISDFGLCKKLKLGRMSFSQRSGIAGTEGWIAPEMLLGNRSTTCLVDIFSLGCVYYYMLTAGKHPFGENFHRQANILSGRFDISVLRRGEEKNETKLSLLVKMICFEPTERPPASAILKHPALWTKEKSLSFLQEASDRVEAEDEDSVLLHHLERDQEEVLSGDWVAALDTIVRDDLRRSRTYRNTVKDLLRAIRNKKHHYREMPDQVKEVYGPLPNQFMQYWDQRFPKLLVHTYNALQSIKTEAELIKYYDKHYDFVKDDTNVQLHDTKSENLDYNEIKVSSSPPPGIPGQVAARAQRDIFEEGSAPSSAAPSSILSSWEDLHSDISSSQLQPCQNYPEQSNEKLQEPEEGLRRLADLSRVQTVKDQEMKVRKPVFEKVKETPRKLSFAAAVKNDPWEPDHPPSPFGQSGLTSFQILDTSDTSSEPGMKKSSSVPIVHPEKTLIKSGSEPGFNPAQGPARSTGIELNLRPLNLPAFRPSPSVGEILKSNMPILSKPSDNEKINLDSSNQTIVPSVDQCNKENEDENDDEDINEDGEEEKEAGAKEKHKRIRKRRKHQKKSREPRSENIELENTMDTALLP